MSKMIIRTAASNRVARLLESQDEEDEDSVLEKWDLQFELNQRNPIIEEYEEIVEEIAETIDEKHFENEKKQDIVKDTKTVNNKTVDNKKGERLNESNNSEFERH